MKVSSLFLGSVLLMLGGLAISYVSETIEPYLILGTGSMVLMWIGIAVYYGDNP